MKTYNAPVDVENKWVVIDATDVVVGRLASYVAKRLRGKHRPDFTPHIDTGDHVVVINAEKPSSPATSWLTKSTTATPATRAASSRPQPAKSFPAASRSAPSNWPSNA